MGAIKKNFHRYTMPFCHFTGYNLWLLKPTKLNRGRGIHVINNLGQLKALISRYCEGWYKPAAPNAKAPVIQTHCGGVERCELPAQIGATPYNVRDELGSLERAANTDDEDAPNNGLLLHEIDETQESVDKGSPD